MYLGVSVVCTICSTLEVRRTGGGKIPPIRLQSRVEQFSPIGTAVEQGGGDIIFNFVSVHVE